MNSTPCQRWSERRERYRPSGERIDPSRYTVAISEQSPARAFVETHHYSGSWVAARLSVGLYQDRGPVWSPELVGVCVFSVPMQPAALTAHLAGPGVELGRLVLLDEVPGNGESWFVARAFRLLRSELGLCRVLSYSDPLRRVREDGSEVCPGHIGIVYQALNATYRGRSSARWLHLDRVGRTISGRALGKIRAQDRGCVAAERDLVARGAPARVWGEEPAAWLARVLPTFRRVYHPGNHVYTWGSAHAGQPYPRRAAS